jgi:ABC-type multidrug transport system fused ATPase/permease subunit
MESFFKVYKLLKTSERRKIYLIIGLIILSSVLELISVGSLGPFMAIVIDPNFIQKQKIIFFIYNILNYQNYKYFLLLCGCAVFLLVLASTIFKMIVLYSVQKFAAFCRYDLGINLYKLYLYQPYQYFLNKNTNELSKNILTEVEEVINGVLLPAMYMLTNIFLTLILFIFIILVNPFLTLAAVGIFGFVYGGLYLILRSKLANAGKELFMADSIRYKITSESFGGIKDIKILKKEQFFINSYSEGVRKSINARVTNQIISSLPVQAMQTLAIGFSIAMIVFSVLFFESFLSVLPALAVYAFAIMRIVPNFQGIFSNASQLRMYKYVANTLYSEMTTFKVPVKIYDGIDQFYKRQPLDFSNSIELKDIEFSYPGTKKKIFKGINLSISKNTTLGLVGATGCGKTTLVDVIMGLLKPVSGEVFADDEAVVTPLKNEEDEKLARWQWNFGYVPQQIFLSDDTVAANIAFGIPRNLRDINAIEYAAKAANLHEFILNELPDGYDTYVGERGIRLSGGQRQRIGIARSLYHDPNILVMDEATSALDSLTETAVMDAIHNLMHVKTIIIIAHRISTVRECDILCLMEHGSIADMGTYDELMKRNEHFRSMAKIKNE